MLDVARGILLSMQIPPHRFESQLFPAMKKYPYLICLFALQLTVATGQPGIGDERRFIHNVHTGLDYFRIDYVEQNSLFERGANNNTVFQVNVKSRRNNFEEVLMLGFSCVGKVIDRELSSKRDEENPPLVPSVLVVNCNIPVGRGGTVLSVSANSAIVVQFIEGGITAEQFWGEIKNSFEYSSDIGVTMSSPKILRTDVDFENLVSARIAMESKNNPRVSTIISMANKASYIPGLQGRLESMLMNHMKSNHTELMTQVMGGRPSDEQMLRIGKLVFFHVGNPLDKIIDAHSGDSLRYVWGGRVYPRPLDEYYDEYYRMNDVPQPKRSR